MLQNCKFCEKKTILNLIVDEYHPRNASVKCQECGQFVTRKTPQAAKLAWNVAQNNVPALWDDKTEEAFNNIMRGGVE